jgi:mannose-6-phosphate isomerase class I
MKAACRNSSQFVMPVKKPPAGVGGYDIYPAFPLQQGMIRSGFKSLADHARNHDTVIIDGYPGILWNDFKDRLDSALVNTGIQPAWIDISKLMKPAEEIEALVEPFLGGDDPLFGTRTDLELIDFFNQEKLGMISADNQRGITILYGTGALLAGLKGLNIYLDVPKNEIQYRARAGSITNIGRAGPEGPKKMYKRFYFVDWVVVNHHKEKFIDTIDIFADLQRPEEITWTSSESIMATLDAMSVNYFRVRPWFEPGTWGGNWIKSHINGLSSNVPNYAWSFELIVPENGLLFESEGFLLELSFDWLMYRAGRKVLGHCHDRFGSEFPIRFDFLDTFGGGNLSIQCHPGKEYMRRHFGEVFTQEESYYILDAATDAGVYLGFHDNIDPVEFRKALETSFFDSVPVEIDRYVQRHPSKKHDLFLIPPGTIHGSGLNNLVLEISSTPYIFTFKLYDWLRPDLDGKPRQLNLSRGMDNLRFDRCGNVVTGELISVPLLLHKDQNHELWHLPTHTEHLYDIHRYEFTGEITIHTEGRCHVLSLVEGSGIIVKTCGGFQQRFSYAETFVIPAATGSYQVKNEALEKAVLIKAFVK